jgi:uncharacterized protein YbjQ (UPF0145 family)
MLISAGDTIEGYKISEDKGIVFGIASSTEGVAYRQSALKKILENASKLNANAVVNLHLEIYTISSGVQEITAYGNAVVAESINAPATEKHRVNLEAYIPKKDLSPVGKIHDIGEYKFVICPQCGTKYKLETKEDGTFFIKGFDDVDDIEPGLQVFCLRCGTKFTVPEQ